MSVAEPSVSAVSGSAHFSVSVVAGGTSDEVCLALASAVADDAVSGDSEEG